MDEWNGGTPESYLALPSIIPFTLVRFQPKMLNLGHYYMPELILFYGF